MNHEKLTNFIKQLDRSLFIDSDSKSLANFDTALPIGYGQTISQPSLVFEMSLLLDINKDCKVLEIGTGSGFQTAILSHFADHVYTIELIPELSKIAQKRLTDMGFNNITFIVADGSEGLKEYAPYDRIMVTAASEEIPPELINQLNITGIMIIPVGNPIVQTLKLIRKDDKGNIAIKPIMAVRFVEFKGKYGWEKIN
jgi:protein-L-isoaspartate(D-aspartate) O-methyltransferase